MNFTDFLSFSDAAKFADVARSIVSGRGYGGSFTFYSSSVFQKLIVQVFPLTGIPPFMPFSIFVFFKIFGINDLAVIAASFFYFLLTLIFVFLLAKKIFKSNLARFLSTLAVGFNYDLIHYAISGASESPFIFEIVAASYFISIRKKIGTVAAILLLVLMYFTRPQAFIYIAGLIFYWLLLKFKTSKAVLLFGLVLAVGFLADYFILPNFAGRYFLYSVTGRGLGTISNVSAGGSASTSLRGTVVQSAGRVGVLVQAAKKIFYNLYNFYKLMPQIMSPYLFAFFAIGLFKKGKDKCLNSFKVATLFMVGATLIVTAASIPFFRYLHPIVPLIYIVSVGTLVEILKSQISNNKLVIIVSTFLILLFGVGQTLGVLVLDSRFERSTHNVGKPPVYVVLSQILKANTNPNQVVITNLDTWGSWYGERKTVWFPLQPQQLIDPATGKIPFDAIYLTSYLIDDENYYMGADWRLIFNNPNDPKKWTCDGCSEIAKEFVLKGINKVNANEDYERQDATGILLVRK